jgi:SAM-dependent methyltransferase
VIDDQSLGCSLLLSRGRLHTHLVIRRVQRRLRDLLLLGSAYEGRATFREDLARRYLRGEGIEIGALHFPLRVPPAVRVRYVDLATRNQLLEMHSSAVYGNPGWVIETDIIDDFERLGTFTDESVDFAIANHALEHTEDPIAALKHAVRVLRPGGILFLTLPDARHTFDALRARTTIEHLFRDHREGPVVSRKEHHREWAFVECVPEEDVADRMAQFAREGARHHFHSWELEGFLAFLRALELPVVIELAQAHLDEFAVILRRGDRAPRT